MTDPVLAAYVLPGPDGVELRRASPGGRLDLPPLMGLAQATRVCPVPLPVWLSDSGGKGIQVCAVVPPGWVSLRRCVGYRNRPLAALARAATDLLPVRGSVAGAGFAGAAVVPAGRTSWLPGPAGDAGPSCAAPAA